MTLVLLVAALCGAADESYLLRVDGALQAARADLPAMQAPAEEAARLLIAGGRLFAAGQPSMVSELSGRAGGFMMLEGIGKEPPKAGDVVLFSQEAGEPLPASLSGSGAYIVVFGSKPVPEGVPFFSNHADAGAVSPTLANAIPGWLFTGELIAACTRQGKMPVVMESIGVYSGITRANQHREKGMTRFHDDVSVPPVEPGVLGNRFCDAISAMLRRVDAEERGDLDRAGAWCAEAKANGRQLFMYSMGHLFPDEVGKTDIGKMFKSAVWNAGFRLSPPPEDSYGEGDAIVHIGYQRPPVDLLRKAVPIGARVAYVSVYGDRDYVRNPAAAWIDPMWPYEDACVPLEGYEVPVLASSGIVNGAIAWEIYRLAQR